MLKRIILENVPACVLYISVRNFVMVSKPPARESYFEKLKKRLEALGYHLQGEVKDCTGHGVPQREIAEKNDRRNQTPAYFATCVVTSVLPQ